MSSRIEYCLTNRPGALISGIMITLLLAACVGFAGCQTYTSGLKQSVARADETSAIAALHSIALAQQTYSMSNDGKYGTFQQLAEGGVLTPSISPTNPEVRDYVLRMNVSQKPGSAGEEFYSCNADPKPAGQMAGLHFYIDSTSREMHVNPTQPATATDPTYQP